MPQRFTAESLLLEDGFLDYCFDPNPENMAKWEMMVRKHNISVEVIAEATAMLNMLTPVVGTPEIAHEVIKLKDVIDERERSRKRRISGISVFAGVSAIVSVVLFFVLRTDPGSITEKIAAQHQTGTGERKKISLPDGTVVILNSNTRFTYNDSYNSRDRKVYLTGRAFFKVAKDPLRPFSVINDHFSTTALGTSFYVSGDSLEDFSVRLLEGRVKINSGEINETEYLEAGEELICLRNERHFIKQVYDTAYLSQWLTGKIVFRKTPVAEAFTILQKWYGVEITDNRNKRTDISINGTYENALLEDILKVVCFSLRCQYRYSGNRIIIE